jgi:hypothetical protein
MVVMVVSSFCEKCADVTLLIETCGSMFISDLRILVHTFTATTAPSIKSMCDYKLRVKYVMMMMMVVAPRKDSNLTSLFCRNLFWVPSWVTRIRGTSRAASLQIPRARGARFLLKAVPSSLYNRLLRKLSPISTLRISTLRTFRDKADKGARHDGKRPIFRLVADLPGEGKQYHGVISHLSRENYSPRLSPAN